MKANAFEWISRAFDPRTTGGAPGPTRTDAEIAHLTGQDLEARMTRLLPNHTESRNMSAPPSSSVTDDLPSVADGRCGPCALRSPEASPNANTGRKRLRHRRRGFSLLELLVAVGIIAVLVSLVTVVGGRLRRAAEKTNTTRLMNDIKTGLVQFNNDFGFYPPLLDDDLTLPASASEKEDLGFYSTLTLVPYLIGLGDLNQNGEEGLNDPYDDGEGGLGLRNPGPDLSWGGARDADNRLDYLQQLEQSQGGTFKGRVYGPYIELGDQYTFAEAEDRDGNDLTALFVFSDAWGSPIRYYRDWDQTSNTSDMPYPREWIATRVEDDPVEAGWIVGYTPDAISGAKIAIESAPFALFSVGADLKVDERGNAELVNNDNMLLLGD